MRISDHVATAGGPSGYMLHRENSGLVAHTLAGGPRYFRPLVRQGWQWECSPQNERWYWGATDLLRDVGDRRLTFFDDCVDSRGPTPYQLIRAYARHRAEIDRPDWRPLLDGGALPRRSVVLMMQGWLYPRNPSRGVISVHRDALLVLGVSAVRSLATLMSGPDITKLMDEGSRRLLCFHRAGEERRVAADGWRTVKVMTQPPLAGPWPHGHVGYDCRLVERFNDDAQPWPAVADHEAALPWDRVVRRLTAAEQVAQLASTLPSDLIDNAMAGTRYETHLKDHV